MNKMFLTFLILFSNGTRTSTDNEKISGAFESCSKGDVGLCGAALSGTLAVAAASSVIFNKGYNIIKEIVLLIRSKILIKNIEKILNGIDAELTTFIDKSKEEKDEIFQKTDLWLAINTLKELSVNFKDSISSISKNMSFAEIKETIGDIKKNVDVVLAQKTEDLNPIVESAILIRDNLVAGKDELKWIFDRSQKIDDRYSMKDAKEIDKLLVVLKNLRINAARRTVSIHLLV